MVEKILNNTTPYGKIRASHEGSLHSSTLNGLITTTSTPSDNYTLNSFPPQSRQAPGAPRPERRFVPMSRVYQAVFLITTERVHKMSINNKIYRVNKSVLLELLEMYAYTFVFIYHFYLI